VRIHALVRGMVQGVGFRYFVLNAARTAGLVGFVKNLRDGSVEILAEGPREELERFARDVSEGPRRGLVRDVQFTWAESTGEFESFEVSF
ncbi:MAG: acylphosphatase, partial [Candidatus Eisenbacteria sp.]|nr:acylphosphatase [Candidatus Eisenbacteria bacterium]